MHKENLHPKHQAVYGATKFILGPAAFKRWYDHMLELKDLPEDQWGEIKMSDYKVQTTDPKQAVAAARQAVAGYSSSNGTRKAVEALANVIEQII